MRAKDYRAALQKAAEILGEAMHVVDAGGRTIIYNEAMARLEKINVEDALGRSFEEVFTHIPLEESTLYRALKKNEATVNKEQTYLNVYGRQVTTVNTRVPIESEGRVVAAMEIAKDITDIKNMSDTILELQEETILGDRGEKEEGRKRKGVKKYRFDDIKGESPLLREEIKRAQKASATDVSLFIYGETGTGKELFAQSVHYDGVRGDKPFLAQNCAALPESLLEGILFGTARGGFTGAVDRAGLFEQADGGTLLLDEISAMPYELQGKLLRVLQEEYIRRVGGNKDIPVDVRIIATVNEPAEKLIEEGALRKDLYYRLKIVGLNIPPLRERKEDIPLLAEHFLEKYNRKYGREIWMISREALEKLRDYDYPGNVRELENIIMSAVSMSEEGHALKPEDIEISRSYRRPPGPEESFNSEEQSLSGYLASIEENLIRTYLIKNQWNISRTAEELGMLRQNLQHKIKKYDLI